MKDLIVKYLSELLGALLEKDEIEAVLEIPKVESHGDLSMPMFALAKNLKKSPVQIAEEYKTRINENLPDFLEKCEALGPYLNFFFDKDRLSKNSVNSILEQEYKSLSAQYSKKILIEYAQPNTNKPLHLGHLRNLLLGKSVITLLQRAGNNVIPVTLFNDRGIAICKSMLMYQMFGNNETPESSGMKSDQFVGKYYVMFEQKKDEMPEINDKAREMLRLWESGDEKTRELWKKMNNLAISGMKETFAVFNMPYEKVYFESDHYERGVQIIMEGLEKGIFEKTAEGAIVYKVDTDNIYTMLREDGTALYMTQDIALAEQKKQDYNADKYVFVVGNDHIYHFNILFEILEKLGISKKEDNYHFAYGMVTRPEGKMSSRKGTVIGADALIDEVTGMAKQIVLEKNEGISADEAEDRAKKIGLGALTYFMLKSNPMSDMVFDPEKSLSFEGETGPYIMYAYARIKSMLKKVENTKGELRFGEEEYSLAKMINEYKSIIKEAAEKYKPSHLANYLLELAQAFNEFYHKHKVIGNENEYSRLKLCEATSLVLKDGLSLLGIEVLEEM